MSSNNNNNNSNIKLLTYNELETIYNQHTGKDMRENFKKYHINTYDLDIRACKIAIGINDEKYLKELTTSTSATASADEQESKTKTDFFNWLGVSPLQASFHLSRFPLKLQSKKDVTVNASTSAGKVELPISDTSPATQTEPIAPLDKYPSWYDSVMCDFKHNSHKMTPQQRKDRLAQIMYDCVHNP